VLVVLGRSPYVTRAFQDVLLCEQAMLLVYLRIILDLFLFQSGQAVPGLIVVLLYGLPLLWSQIASAFDAVLLLEVVESVFNF